LRVCQQHEAGGETGTEGGEQSQSPKLAGEAGQNAIEHEQHAGGRHIAEIPKHGSLMLEGAWREGERLLTGLDHLRAAGMADEAVDIAERQAVPLEKFARGGTELGGGEAWDV